MKAIGWMALIGLILVSGIAWAQDTGRYSVLQGVTDEANVQFTVVHNRSEPLQFFARDGGSGALFKPTAIQVVERAFSDYALSRVTFKNLPRLMTGSLLIENLEGKLLEVRGFKLLDTSRRELSVALISCAAGYLYNSQIWQQLNASNPELVLFIGDNLYADRPNIITKRPADPKQLWEQYVAARQTFDFYFRRDLIPALATWDDHDFGKDDGDMHFEHADAARQVFNEFWAQDEGVSPLLVRGPGIASAYSAFGMQFVFFDDRSFRTAEHEAEPTGWGAAQKWWVEGLLERGREPLMLVNGEQFFGAYRGKYSVESGFPEDMKWLLNSVKASGRAAGFVSGDIHYSEFMELESDLVGQVSVEITSSSMHSVTFPGQHNRFTNSRRRAATSAHNFILVDLGITDDQILGQATSIGVDGLQLFQKSLQIGGGERTGVWSPGLKPSPMSVQMIRQNGKLRAAMTSDQRI